MGRFEELLSEAKSGNEEALDLLEQEFGGSQLRNQNESLSQENQSLKEWKEKNAESVRKATFDALLPNLDEGLRETVSVSDFADTDPDELTLDAIRNKANERQTELQRTIEVAAKAAGFETVEEYQTALNTVKQTQNSSRQGMEQFGRSASSGGVGDSGGADTFETSKKDFDAAKQLGAADDEALGEFLHTHMAQQAPRNL